MNHAHDVKDKNRDFIKELEEKKRKEKEERARQERRKKKLHEKMTRKILQDADARQQSKQLLRPRRWMTSPVNYCVKRSPRRTKRSILL